MIIQLIDLGHKQITQFGEIVDYNGEILDGNKATGLGKFTTKGGTKYSAHFVDDLIEGALEMTIMPYGDRVEGESKDNEYHGKRTYCGHDGTIFNYVFENGIFKTHKEIKDKD